MPEALPATLAPKVELTRLPPVPYNVFNTPSSDTLEMPLANICGHGDVQVPTRDVVIKCCKKAGLKVEKFEIRKGMRMHCVVRKAMEKAIGNER